MFARFEVEPGEGIKWATLLLAVLAGVETRVHWGHFSARDDAGLVVLWFVVACFSAALLTGAIMRLVKGRRSAQLGAGGYRGQTIEARHLADEGPNSRVR